MLTSRLACLIGGTLLLLCAQASFDFSPTGGPAPSGAHAVKPATSRNRPGVARQFAPQARFENTLVPPIELAEASRLEPAALDRDFAYGGRAIFHPHGERVCASGCAASRHPTPELTVELFHNLMAQYAVEPIDPPGQALETLLFHGRQTRELIKVSSGEPVDQLRRRLLLGELSRTHAEISVRVIDTSGSIRAALPPTQVPLDRRHVFPLDADNLQPLRVSGTVKRVGLHHLWTRL